MSEWKEVKIGDVCSVKRGASPRPIQNFMCKNGMPWVKIADATRSNSRFINSTEEFITEAGVPKSRIVTPGTLIVSNSATPGLPKIMNITGCVHDGWLIIDDYNGVLKEYMYYKFIDIRRILSNQANGSVFMNLKTDIVKDFPIKVPSIREQEKIVALLENIDEKNECNNKICANLEAQAQALFKHWFVDFAPFKDGKFVKSELGLIPEGWRVFELQELVTIKRGGSPRPIQDYLSEKGYRWLKISDATCTASPFVFEIKEKIKESGLSKTVHLEEGSLVLSNSATPGIPKIMGVDTCIHDGWLYFPQSRLSKYFLFLLFKNKYKYILSQGNGSVFTNLKTDIVKALKFVLPPKNTMEDFDRIAESLFNAMEVNTLESLRLATLRDTLLPKLMSGQIKV